MQKNDIQNRDALSYWEQVGIFDDLRAASQEEIDRQEPQKVADEPIKIKEVSQTDLPPSLTSPPDDQPLETSVSPKQSSTPSNAFDHIQHIISEQRTNEISELYNKSNISHSEELTVFMEQKKQEDSPFQSVVLELSQENPPEEHINELTVSPNDSKPVSSNDSKAITGIEQKEVTNKKITETKQTKSIHKTVPTPQVSHILHGKNAEFSFTTGKTPILVRIEGPYSLLNGSEESDNQGQKPLIALTEPIAQQRSGLHPHRFSEGAEEKENLLKPHTSSIGKRLPTHQSSIRGASLPKAITEIPALTAVPTEKDLNRITKWNEKPLLFSGVIMGAFLVFFGIIGIYRVLQPDFEPINWQQMRLTLSGDEEVFQVESSTESARYVGGGGGRFPARGEDWTPSDWARCGCPECTKNLNQWKAVQAALNTGKKTDLPDSSIIVTPGGKIDPLGSGSNDLYRTPQGANQNISPGGAIMY